MPKKVLITHYDLDGVTCAIVLDKVFKFDTVLKGGYYRIDSFIDEVPPGSFVVTSDIALTLEQYLKLKNKTQGLIVIDHHPETADLQNKYPHENIVFDDKRAGCKLCLDFLHEDLGEDIRRLVNAANAYDLFLREEDPNWFKFGYDLNLIFWDKHFDGFRSRFKDGIHDSGFEPWERKFITDAKARRDKWLAESTYVEIENSRIKGLICAPADNSIQNDVPFFAKGYEVYYIIMQYKQGKDVSISVRSPEGGLDNAIPAILDHPAIVSAGGHPKACGINFHPNSNPSLETITEVINIFHKAYVTELIPF